jgi:hypothetical protein
MATLNFPNLTLEIPIWYLDPPTPPPPSEPIPYLSLTHFQQILTTLVAPKAPTQAQPNPTLVGKGVDRGGKAKKKWDTDNPRQAMVNPNSTPRVIPPCSLCNLSDHATNNCPRLPKLKELFNVDDLEPSPSTPIVQVTLPKSSSKCMHMNHPCALCDTYGHYSHHFPKLPQFHDALEVIHQLDSSFQEHQTPIVEDLTLRQESFFRPIVNQFLKFDWADVWQMTWKMTWVNHIATRVKV